MKSRTEEGDGEHRRLRRAVAGSPAKCPPLVFGAGAYGGRRDRSHRRQRSRPSALCWPVELGAAWPQKPAGRREYFSVKLDDPSLPATISGALYADESGETYSLIWSRPKSPKAS